MIGKVFGEDCTLVYADGTVIGACRGMTFTAEGKTEKNARCRWLTTARKHFISDTIRSLCQSQGFDGPPPFANYTADELIASGQAFQSAIAHFPTNDTEERTLTMKFWFHLSIAPGLRAYGNPFSYEYMLDHSHTTFPHPLNEREKWWDRWPRALDGRPLLMRLALESEWGKYGQPKLTLAAVLEDAWKVALVRADAKVVAFPSHGREDRNRIVDCLRRLRDQSNDGSPWLWVDWPWDTSIPRDIMTGIF